MPLQIAANNDNYNVVVKLLEYGADIHKLDLHMRNVFHYAAKKSPSILRVLSFFFFFTHVNFWFWIKMIVGITLKSFFWIFPVILFANS